MVWFSITMLPELCGGQIYFTDNIGIRIGRKIVVHMCKMTEMWCFTRFPEKFCFLSWSNTDFYSLGLLLRRGLKMLHTRIRPFTFCQPLALVTGLSCMYLWTFWIGMDLVVWKSSCFVSYYNILCVTIRRKSTFRHIFTEILLLNSLNAWWYFTFKWKDARVNCSDSPIKTIDLQQQRNAKYFLPSRNVCKL